MDEKQKGELIRHLLDVLASKETTAIRMVPPPPEEVKRLTAIEDRKMDAYDRECDRNANVNADRLELDRVNSKMSEKEIAHVQAYRDRMLEISAKQVAALEAIASAISTRPS